ncbi:MAG: hypothetical protein KDH20_09290 [Rhodocyclaceae bacterium]|nr:hypothetical protein [Rhodocyclaceae bacterium]
MPVAAHVLVILTLLGDGQLSAAFVNTDDRAACEQRSAAIGAVLKRGAAEVQQMRCVASPLRFTRFSHADAATAPRHAYRMLLGDAALALSPVEDVDQCRRRSGDADRPDGVEIHCVTATQQPLPDGDR